MWLPYCDEFQYFELHSQDLSRDVAGRRHIPPARIFAAKGDRAAASRGNPVLARIVAHLLSDLPTGPATLRRGY